MFWDIAFDPDLLDLDVAIEGAADAVKSLSKSGWSIVIISSRPKWYAGSGSGISMEAETRLWLQNNRTENSALQWELKVIIIN